jgi:hypothetical protein
MYINVRPDVREIKSCSGVRRAEHAVGERADLLLQN